MPDAFAPLVIAAAVLFFIALVWALTTYNGLIRLRQHVAESWSTIDTELKRRHDLIPNLIEVCQGYAAHEKTVFEQVAQARGEAAAATHPTVTPRDQARHESALTGSLRSLFAVSEGYPELKASDHFLALQKELAITEDRIQAARRFFNANVRDLNTRVEQVPSNIVAGLFHFERADYFEIDEASVRAAPSIA
ncbi:MAG: LemA family protein [Algisphaera sp.]